MAITTNFRNVIISINQSIVTSTKAHTGSTEQRHIVRHKVIKHTKNKAIKATKNRNVLDSFEPPRKENNHHMKRKKNVN